MPFGAVVAADRHGQLYVISADNRIQKLGAAGQVLATWGGGGPWDVALVRPTALAVDEDGAIYIADRATGRLLKVQQLLPTLR